MATLRSLAFSLTFALASPAAVATAVDWPPQPSRLQLETPYGTLGIWTSEYIYEARLYIDNVEVEPPVRGLLNITYAYNLPQAGVALVSVSDGSNICPIAYRWVTMKKGGYTVTPAFGSCSAQIKVSARKGAFTLQTPNTEKPDKIDTYVYDGKTVKLHSKP